MSMFRSKKLDLGCFVNTWIIRDHTKRKVFEKHEAERYELNETHLHFTSTHHRPYSFDGARRGGGVVHLGTKC